MFGKIIICVWLLFIGFMGNAQSVRTVFKKLGQQYSMAKPLQYQSKYVLYKDFDSKKIMESYTGVFYKNNQNEIYMKIGETEILNSKSVNLKVSHPEKAIEISTAVPTYFGDFDMKPLLELCKIDKFVDYKGYWEITMTAKPFSSLPYSKIEVRVSKTYFLQKQVFYYNTATNFSQDFRKPDVHYPRLEVIYANYNRKAVNASVFKNSSYFSTFGKDRIVLSPRLQKYEIVDQRNNSNN
ncbi:hypothetical protein FNW52_14845 [Flavobacterium sp. ZT3R18]|uniref:hypothetical protein n=1 Tax=Flavobacterium sp. ZT3R18 TaxID=2594429 RepID=UPI00117BB0AA|nr:hypothetical protein [Flavobacterium sp. ZT3R18]TRX33703.1 hypothetical protein FNW52_14845 [Flavobacterium sp. ZT3R18]